MRILHVIETLGRGGAEQVLLNVLPEIQARGHVCEVGVLWPRFDLQSDLEARGVPVHRLNWSYKKRWDIPGAAARINRLARRGRFDILHSHLVFPDLYIGMSRRLSPRVLRVASLQNTDFDFFGSSVPGRVLSKLLPVVLRRGFDGLAAVGTPVAQHFREHVPGLEVETIFNAVPIPNLPANPNRADILARNGANPNAFVALVAARLAPEKNHAFLLQALEILRGRGLRPQVLLAGDGPLRTALEQEVAQKKLGEQVIFCGRLQHAPLQELMSVADLFLLPSRHEGLPLAIAEALALQRAVLATPVGGVPDIIEDGVSGLLVPPSDALALATGIERLMNDAALRQRLGAQGRVRVEESFSAKKIAEQWEQFYSSRLNTR